MRRRKKRRVGNAFKNVFTRNKINSQNRSASMCDIDDVISVSASSNARNTPRSCGMTASRGAVTIVAVVLAFDVAPQKAAAVSVRFCCVPVPPVPAPTLLASASAVAAAHTLTHARRSAGPRLTSSSSTRAGATWRQRFSDTSRMTAFRGPASSSAPAAWVTSSTKAAFAARLVEGCCW